MEVLGFIPSLEQSVLLGMHFSASFYQMTPDLSCCVFSFCPVPFSDPIFACSFPFSMNFLLALTRLSYPLLTSLNRKDRQMPLSSLWPPSNFLTFFLADLLVFVFAVRAEGWSGCLAPHVHPQKAAGFITSWLGAGPTSWFCRNVLIFHTDLKEWRWSYLQWSDQNLVPWECGRSHFTDCFEPSGNVGPKDVSSVNPKEFWQQLGTPVSSSSVLM